MIPEKFVFRTDSTGSIGEASLAPQQHIDDCSAIHFLHLDRLYKYVFQQEAPS